MHCLFCSFRVPLPQATEKERDKWFEVRERGEREGGGRERERGREGGREKEDLTSKGMVTLSLFVFTGN